MKVWTVMVTNVDGEVSPFVESYRTKNAGVRAIEANATEMFEYMVDPNDGVRHRFPGLDWADDFSTAETKDGRLTYHLTETELQW